LLTSEAHLQGVGSHRLTHLHFLFGRPKDRFQGTAAISVILQEGVPEMDEAWLRHITVRVGVTTVLLGMAAMIAQRTTLQELAAVREMTALVAPAAAVCHPPIVRDPGLSNEPFALQNLRSREPPCAPVGNDQAAFDRPS
jgi:hypothetical protein